MYADDDDMYLQFGRKVMIVIWYLLEENKKDWYCQLKYWNFMWLGCM